MPDHNAAHRRWSGASVLLSRVMALAAYAVLLLLVSSIIGAGFMWAASGSSTHGGLVLFGVAIDRIGEEPLVLVIENTNDEAVIVTRSETLRRPLRGHVDARSTATITLGMASTAPLSFPWVAKRGTEISLRIDTVAGKTVLCRWFTYDEIRRAENRISAGETPVPCRMPLGHD
jgi:hypothetical protein